MKQKLIPYSVYLFFLLIPFDSISLPGVKDFGLSKLGVIALVFSLLMNLNYLKKALVVKDKITQKFLMYSLWVFLTCLWSIDQEKSLLRYITFIIPMLFIMHLLCTYIINHQMLKRAMLCYSAGVLVSVFSMINMLLNPEAIVDTGEAGGDRLTTFGNNQNMLADMICISVAFIFYNIKNCNSKLEKGLLYIFAFLSAISVLLTGSRTGTGIICLIVFIYILTFGKKVMLMSFLSIIIVIMAVLPLIPETNIMRILEASDQISEGNMTGRGYIWEKGWNAFWQTGQIIQGVGYETFQTLLKNTYGSFNRPAHNTYLNVFVEQGLIGLFLFLNMLISVFRKSLKVFHLQKDITPILIVLPGVIAMMTTGLQESKWLFVMYIVVYKIYYFKVVKYDKKQEGLSVLPTAR